MKIAIPLAEGKLTAHFGHCQTFALVDVQDKKITQINELEPPPHEPGVLPRWLHEQEVSHVIAGGLGNRAQKLLKDQGITVMVGAPEAEAKELVQRYLNGTLMLGKNSCNH
ncbi:MAG: ATPase [Fibrobacter sp.]|nr:ATPase [Fibrobacter sp.]